MEKGVFGSFSDASRGELAVESLRQHLNTALDGIREEFDDHLESINENTNEVEANYELLSRLEAKVDRLEGQMEQLQLALTSLGSAPSQQTTAQRAVKSLIELDEREKAVFLLLYTASDEKPLTYREIASALKESEFLIRGYVTNMIEKGVPIAKRYINYTAYLSLGKPFKERQAKENLVRLNQRTVREFAV